MIRPLIVMVAVAVAVALCGQSDANAKSVYGGFSGVLLVGDQEPVSFSLSIPIGETVRLGLEAVELEVSVASEDQANLRLMDTDRNVLHTKRIHGSVSETPSFLLRVCGKGVTHVSPKPPLSEVPKCSE